MYAIYIPGKHPCGLKKQVYVQAPMGTYVGHQYSISSMVIKYCICTDLAFEQW